VSEAVAIIASERLVVVRDGLIAEVGWMHEAAIPADAVVVHAEASTLAAGLIDIQINGAFGHDFTSDPSSIWEVGRRLIEHGVTAFLPTIVTSTREARDAARRALSESPPGYRGATPLGLHFEGPFLSPAAAGAHDPALLRLPADADSDVAEWSPDSGVRMVTLAPELPGALELTAALASRGVLVSAGHSTATYEEALAGFDAGIRYVTHLFNAMPPLDKRVPGIAGAALDDPRVMFGLIVDGEHLHDSVVRLAARASARERLSLVTDATAALGMPAGRFVLGGREVVLDGRAVRDMDGRLAGSALSADQALRNLLEATRWMPIAPWLDNDVLDTMTEVPAALLGLTDRGVLSAGRRADLTLWSKELELIATVIDGEVVHGEWP
jgi:N-acetylglucosamine-6-phosphate deacetylase